MKELKNTELFFDCKDSGCSQLYEFRNELKVFAYKGWEGTHRKEKRPEYDTTFISFVFKEKSTGNPMCLGFPEETMREVIDKIDKHLVSVSETRRKAQEKQKNET